EGGVLPDPLAIMLNREGEYRVRGFRGGVGSDLGYRLLTLGEDAPESRVLAGGLQLLGRRLLQVGVNIRNECCIPVAVAITGFYRKRLFHQRWLTQDCHSFGSSERIHAFELHRSIAFDRCGCDPSVSFCP